MTLRHDCLCAKVFIKWCSRNDYLKRDPLADYEVTKPPTPEKYMPSQEDIGTMLTAISDFWDKSKNPSSLSERLRLSRLILCQNILYEQTIQTS